MGAVVVVNGQPYRALWACAIMQRDPLALDVPCPIVYGTVIHGARFGILTTRASVYAWVKGLWYPVIPLRLGGRSPSAICLGGADLGETRRSRTARCHEGLISLTV